MLACCFCTNLVRLQKFALRFAGLHLVSRCWVKQPNSIVFFQFGRLVLVVHKLCLRVRLCMTSVAEFFAANKLKLLAGCFYGL